MIYAIDEMLYYLDFDKFFDIYTDSIEYQIRAIISQNEKLVVYWAQH